MQRFRPASHPKTLSNKAIEALDEKRFSPPAQRRLTLQISNVLGMYQEARSALSGLLALAETRKIGVAGQFMPDDGVSALLAARGIAEQVEEEDFFRFRRIIIPYGGVSTKLRRTWEEQGIALGDFSAPQVRRAQVALGLLQMEGARGLVIGRHEDPETQAIAGGKSANLVIEDTTDTARLMFSPAFGVVCQTTLSPRKTAWLVQQLRFRYRDAKVTFLDTACPTMAPREEALEKLLAHCEIALIVGRQGEASCEALVETAMRRGRTAHIVSGPQDLEKIDLGWNPRVALTAGAFTTDEAIQAVARVLVGS